MNNGRERERGDLQNFTRGAEIWVHQTRMALSSIRMLFLVGLSAFMLCIAFGYFVVLDNSVIYYSKRYVIASAKDLLPGERHTVEMYAHEQDEMPQPVPVKQAKKIAAPYADNFLENMQGFAIVGLLFALGCMVIFKYFLSAFGKDKMQDEHLRGGKLTDAAQLTKRLIKDKAASHYRIAGVPLRQGSESYHILIAGAQGTGKSVAILDMLDQLRAEGKKVAIYDPTGQFVELFYRPGKDIILNPMDERSPRWTPWNEIRKDYDYANLAEGLIPKPSGTNDPFWALAGRLIFKDVCMRLAERGQKTNRALYKSIALESLDKMYEMLKGKTAASYVSPTVEKTGQSIRMVVINALSSFEFLHDTGEDFSIRDWLDREDEDSWLFLSSKESQRAVLTPLISLWMTLLVQYSMDLPPVHGLRHWIVIDELAGLHKMDILEHAMTNLRKFGVPMLLGFQQFSQIIDIYGEQVAKTLVSQAQTKLILRVGDGDTAEALSRLFGKAEIDEKEETFSYGHDAKRDGVSIFSRRQTREIILSSEMMYLPDLTGYFMVPGDYPVAKVQYSYRVREKVADAFIERKVLLAAMAQPAAPMQEVMAGVASVNTETGEIVLHDNIGPDTPPAGVTRKIRKRES
jgi:type IV conjugative transfer system coupling protein TraD